MKTKPEQECQPGHAFLLIRPKRYRRYRSGLIRLYLAAVQQLLKKTFVASSALLQSWSKACRFGILCEWKDGDEAAKGPRRGAADRSEGVRHECEAWHDKQDNERKHSHEERVAGL